MRHRFPQRALDDLQIGDLGPYVLKVLLGQCLHLCADVVPAVDKTQEAAQLRLRESEFPATANELQPIDQPIVINAVASFAARRLKILNGLIPYASICKAWSNQPKRFTADPHYQIPGSNI